MKKVITALSCCPLVVSRSSTDQAVSVGTDEIRDLLESLRATQPALDLESELSLSQVLDYRDYYGLNFPHTQMQFGFLFVDDVPIATHVFVPENVNGTVIAVHGYFDHVGAWKYAIKSLVESDFAVLAFDLPGHGLSGGETGSVESFNDYLVVLEYMANYAVEALPGPYHFVGHSMGAGTIVEYVLKHGLESGQRVVLIAPNIRSNKWWLSRIASALIRPFTDSVSRGFRASSHNEEFLEFREFHDPLQPRRMPTKWFQEQVKWNRHIRRYEISDESLLIIQGDTDGTTDRRYNVPFVLGKFPNAHLAVIPGGEHHLINEAEPMRSQTLEAMTGYLRSLK